VATDLPERLLAAFNQHNLDEFVACFDTAYQSEQPAHPDRSFAGSEQVRTNWAAIFEGIPDFRADLLRSARTDDAWWAEWHWHGTHADATTLDMKGVTIFGLLDDRIAWGRLYVEDVDETGKGIDHVVRHMAAGTE
jgi:hypothetical protein